MTTSKHHGILHIPAGGGNPAPRGRTGSLLLTGDDTAGALTLYEGAFPPGAGSPPLHMHPQSETFVVLAGEAEFNGLRGGVVSTFRAGNGAVVHVPGGTPHGFVNAGTAPLRMLIATMPGGFERYFAALAAVMPLDVPPAEAMADPAIRERVAAVDAAYGVGYARPDEPTTWGVDAPIIHVAAGEGRRVAIGPGTITLKLVSADTADTAAVWEGTIPPGFGSPPPHAHPESETFYLLDGDLAFTGINRDGPCTVRPGPGATVHIPGDTPHQFENVGANPARVLTVATPGGLERYLVEFAAALPAGVAPGAALADPRVRERVAALDATHRHWYAPR